MAGSRAINEVPEQELELLRLRYVTGQNETLAELSRATLISFAGLKRRCAAEGWTEERAAYRAEIAQSSNYDTGVGVAETHAYLMRAMRDAARFAADAATLALESGDSDDFSAALAAVERVNKLLGAVKGTIGPSASGLSVMSQIHSGGGQTSLPAAARGDDDGEVIPANAIRKTRDLVTTTVRLLTERWSEGRQAAADARQAADARSAGVTVTHTPQQAPTPSSLPPAPPVVVTQTPPGTGPPTT